MEVFGYRVHIVVATQFRSCVDSFGRLQVFCLYIFSCTQLRVTNSWVDPENSERGGRGGGGRRDPLPPPE